MMHLKSFTKQNLEMPSTFNNIQQEKEELNTLANSNQNTANALKQKKRKAKKQNVNQDAKVIHKLAAYDNLADLIPSQDYSCIEDVPANPYENLGAPRKEKVQARKRKTQSSNEKGKGADQAGMVPAVTNPPSNISCKRAWTNEQDEKLTIMIIEMGPHQWEHMAQEMGNRTGKQCRERWHNQLNPLLRKAPWTVEEDWILFILQKTIKNCWSEITNVLLGRSDNSIKNYWNSTLRQRQANLDQALNLYFNQATEGENQVNAPKKKQILLQDLLKHYISVAQTQYFEYIRKKIAILQSESTTLDSSEKIKKFKATLMQLGITPEDQLQQTIQVNYSSSSPIPVSGHTSMKDLFEMRKLKQFHKIFLQNQLCRNIQIAMRELKIRDIQNFNMSTIPDPSILNKAQTKERETVLKHFIQEPYEDLQPQTILSSTSKAQNSSQVQAKSTEIVSKQISTKRGAKALTKSIHVDLQELQLAQENSGEQTIQMKQIKQAKPKVKKSESDLKSKEVKIISNVTNNYIYLNKAGAKNFDYTGEKDLTQTTVALFDGVDPSTVKIPKENTQMKPSILSIQPAPEKQHIEQQNLICTKKETSVATQKMERPMPLTLVAKTNKHKHSKKRSSSKMIPESNVQYPVYQKVNYHPYMMMMNFETPVHSGSCYACQMQSSYYYYQLAQYCGQHFHQTPNCACCAPQYYHGTYVQALPQYQCHDHGQNGLKYSQEDVEEQYSCEMVEEDYQEIKEEIQIESEKVSQARASGGNIEKERLAHQYSLPKNESNQRQEAPETLSPVLNSPRVQTCKSSFSPKRSSIGLTRSIAEKPKSQELPLENKYAYNRFEIGTDKTRGENLGVSELAVYSQQYHFLSGNNDFSENCVANTFANQEHFRGDVKRETEFADCAASEDSHLNSNFNTYQCAITPYKRQRLH